MKGRWRIRARWGALVAVPVLLAGTPVLAQPARPAPRAAPAPLAGAEVEGAVLAIQGDELVVDLGSNRGATEGAAVEIWRPIKLKHPVTGKVLTDRFKIGSLELGQVRTTMALARATAALSRPAEVGDVVVLVARREAPVREERPPAGEVDAPKVEVRAAPTPEEQEALAIGAMFDALKGADLVTRIRRYEELARARPEGRFARVLMEEAAALRELAKGRKRGLAEEKPELRNFARPTSTLAGVSIRLAIEMSDAATGAVLHFRKAGVTPYASLPMRALGNGYFAAAIPPDRVVAPKVEYFIEGTTSAGTAVAVVGAADSPAELEVYDPPKGEAPRRIPASLEVLTDYADYNRFRNNDRIWQTEGWVGVRYGDTGIRAVRAGFGVYRGVGGAVDELDKQGLAPRSVGLTYGYLETEIGVVRAFSFIGRAAVGLKDSGIAGGGQLLIRIGSDLRTNLMIGGELLGGVGLRGITQLELKVFERFPILLRTEVSNQPAGADASTTVDSKTSGGAGDVGGRGIVQLGFKVTPDFVIAVRGSFQGRTIQHAGPGFGGALGYSW